MAQQVIIATGESDKIYKPANADSGSEASQGGQKAGGAGVSNSTSEESGRKVDRVMGAFQDWRKYQRELPGMQAKAEQNLLWIESALNDYRMTIIELSYKLDDIDSEVWELYAEIREEVPPLKKETTRLPLALRSRTSLENLRDSWQALLDKQEKGLELIGKAPEALKFYNTTQLLRKQLDAEKVRREESARKIASAHEVVEQSLAELIQSGHEFETISHGSNILRLDDAQKVWGAKLEEFRLSEKSEVANPDEVLKRIRMLNETVREAPISARWIKATETKYSNMVASHDLLVSLGKPVISKNELERAAAMMYEAVPRLWLNGDNEELGKNLQTLEKIIGFYDEAIKRELDFAERRRPGITAALSMSKVTDTFDIGTIVALARSLVNAVDLRDRYMPGHSEDVARLALQTARHMNWNGADLEYLELAGLLHDVGKLAIPETVLSKIKPLTDSERSLIEKHPAYGADLIKPVKGLSRIIPWIYSHQERYDGTGYPDRALKKDIPLGASVISIAEAYTVMTTDLPYRKALSEKEAMDVIQKESGKQFDPQVVEAFVDGVSGESSVLPLSEGVVQE